MCLIGKKAPEFTAKAIIKNEIIDDFSFSNFQGKYIIFYFYPLDFTFVCPTELHAFEEKKEEFKKRDAQVIACSIDSCYSHLAWLNTPKAMGGIQGITYPIVSDITKSISRSYDVLSEEEGVAFRGLFLIDKNGIIRHQLINDLSLGRSVDEAIRTLDALICFEENGEVCPANWHKGEKAMKPNKEGLEEYFS
jgi:peroxiredoxin (alkyl hydroperoxide reductase subunit C)